MKPGEYFLKDEPILLNEGRYTRKVKVVNRGDRGIFVGSHYHFYETDPALDYDRDLGKGMRLNIPAGDTLQFPPGEEKTVELVNYGGNREIFGFRGYVNGPVEQVVTNTKSSKTITRKQYSQKYGPTTGDKVRLADTNLVIELEKDYTVYGDEEKYGYGKVARDGMGMNSRVTRDQSIDLLITNAIIVDYSGIYKADIGIKDGKIHGIGKSGNPDTMEGVDPNLIMSPSTEVLPGAGLIVTAGGIDSHVHETTPELVRCGLQAGITTMLGGGTGPVGGSIGTNISPGPWNLHKMMEAAEAFPMNFGFWGRGNASSPAPLIEAIEAGAPGLKMHEDWGSTPAVIDNCLSVCDAFDVQACIHTDSINESGHVQSTIRAMKGRTIHTYHTEGTGGGHAPDIMEIARESFVLPGSTTPTNPYTDNTTKSNFYSIFEVHNLNRNDPTQVAMAQARVRAETQAAEGVLHDIGALSMFGSDSQAMGHMGETIIRTWQTAHAQKQLRGRLPEEKGDNDNFRVKRYIAKYTINPAITHGISDIVGSLEVGKMADLVVWRADMFGVKPNIIIKGGFVAFAREGDPNGTVPGVQPEMYKWMWGAYGKVPKRTSVTFMSQAGVQNKINEKLGLEKPVYAVRNTRNIGKKDLPFNGATPNIVIDPESFRVKVDGVWVENPPLKQAPLAQRYFLF